MTKIVPAILLSVLSANESAAFNAASRPAVSPQRTTVLSMSNDFDTHYNVDIDRHGNIRDISTSNIKRRDALSRFAATATVAATAFLGTGDAAFAAEKPKPEFSESPTSEASIARAAYDGKLAKPAPVETAPVSAVATAPAAAAEIKKVEDFDGNEAGAVGATDEGSQKSTLDPKIALPGLVDMNLPDMDPRLLIGGVAVAGAALLVNIDEEEGYGGDSTPAPAPKAAPPLGPYGLNAGRNYWDGVDFNAAKRAGLISTPPPALAVAKVPEPAVVKEPAAAVEEKEKPQWALDLPTPYGIQNPGGKNPFIKDILEYCEGGKVTEDCTQTIKGYLDTIAESGQVATSSEVKAIVGYLDSLGGGDSTASSGKKAGAAFTSYLDALSAGSAPPPSSAKAVKSYLDTLAGIKAAAPKEMSPRDFVETPTPVIEEPAAPEWEAEFNVFDNRLTNIEDRVTSLESKVDQIPDQVFEKIEAWQSSQEERLSAEVKKIVNALTPPPAPVVVAQEVVTPEPVVEEAPPAPEPAVVSEPAAPIVQASPLGGAIPDRGGMPKAGPIGGPKKRYGFGGGAPWKGAQASTTSAEPAAAAVPEPSPEPEVFAPEPVAPVVPASPLIGAIPDRGGMPGPSSSGPKKGYGFGGGASWKVNP